MSDESEVVLRPYRLAQVFSCKDRLAEAMSVTFISEVIQGRRFEQFVGLIVDNLPGQISFEVARESVKYLSGTKLDKATINEVCWRLAGNLKRLKSGYAVRPWRRQQFSEWVPLEIVDTRLHRTRRGKFGAIFSFRVLAGTPCPMVITKFWTHRFCGYFSSHMGFSKPWGDYPFAKMEEFVSLRLYALLDSCSGSELPRFEHLKVPSSMEADNRKILKSRIPGPDRRCPKSYKHPCHQCHLGYYDCDLATHPRTLVKSLCDVCDKETWFDPERIPLGICIQCQYRKDS